MALQNNRMAMDTVREVLDCPCSHGMSVALLLILTTHQVMESYRTVLIQHQAGPSAPHNQSATGNDYLLPIRDTPLAIGGYLLDDNMRAKVIVQAEIMRNQPEEAVLGTYVEALRAGLNELLHTLDDQRTDI
ncbi:Zn(2)-C6 fungal-type DNA-binding domain protein [Aspergillus terreus]|uniref:Zn(2)-C6 fungal-type DNA-binding domain protein n=1 Tax=Aspergillus terreus TaxID=33178 RepID=A0A5M3ZDR8_ASPTE|nr:hypothetical protein ATETN484_0017007300 [Aspergillus terreus]GFF21744.1 Zn(2)-C6 fungal-type DNA-binding domain protein [Aspergillus terreus]